MKKLLPRPFIYCDREVIDDFLDENELWRELYEVFLVVKDNSYKWKISSEILFNEVCYHCMRVIKYDKHPEEDVQGNYLDVAVGKLGKRYASNLCFSMVYAVLSLLDGEQPIRVSRFCKMLDKYLESEEFYYPYFYKFVEEQKEQGKMFTVDFSSQPEFPENMQGYDYKWWKEATNNFNQDTIKEIVSLWEFTSQQLNILQMIEDAFDEDELEQKAFADLPF